MKRFSLFSSGFLIIIILLQVMPMRVHASSLLLVDCGIDPMGKVRNGAEQIAGTTEYECGFLDFIAEVQKLINFAFIIALPVTIVSLAWAGIKLLLAQGNASGLNEAKKFIQHVLVGFAIVLCAWLFIYNISSYLLCPRYYTPFLGGVVPHGGDVAACRP
jgi:hypothetical protein